MKYIAILFFVATVFVSCSKGGDHNPCNEGALDNGALVPTEQDSNQ